MEEYKQQRLLGEGVYGQVNLCRHKGNNQMVAIKTINFDALSDDEKEIVRDEAAFMLNLRDLNHPHVVTFFGSMKAGSLYHFVLEFCEGASLDRLLEERKKRQASLEEDELIGCLWQLTSGIDFIHQNGVVHRDLKPANVLATREGNLKITDFCVSAALSVSARESRARAEAFLYSAPEAITEAMYTTCSDIWSLGAIVYQLATLAPPFAGESLPCLLTSISSSKFDPMDESRKKELRDLIESMLSVDPTSRPSCNEILEMQFVSSCSEVHLSFAAVAAPPSRAGIEALLDACRNGDVAKVLKLLAVQRRPTPSAGPAGPAGSAGASHLDAVSLERLLEVTAGTDELYMFCQKLIDVDPSFPSALLQGLHTEATSTHSCGTNSMKWPLRRLLTYAAKFIRLLCDVQYPTVRDSSFEDALLLCNRLPKSELHDAEADMLCVRLYYETDLLYFKSAVATAERLRKLLGKVTSRVVLSECYAVLGWHCVIAERTDDSLRMCQLAVDSLPSTTPCGNLATILRTCGRVYYFNGRFEIGRLMLTQAVAVVKEEFKTSRFRLAQVLEDIDTYLGRTGFAALSVDTCKYRLEIFERLFGRNNARTAMAFLNLAGAVFAKSRATEQINEAIGLLEIVFEIYSKIVGAESGLLSGAYQLRAQIMSAMADRSADQNQRKSFLDKTLQMSQRNLDVTRKTFGEDTVMATSAYISTALVYYRIALLKQAEEMMKKAAATLQKLYKDDLAVLSSLCNDLALLYFGLKDYEKAEKHLIKAIDIHNRHPTTSSLNLETAYVYFASIYKATERQQKVEQYTLARQEHRKSGFAEKHRQRNLPIGDEPIGPVMAVKEIKSKFFSLLAVV